MGKIDFKKLCEVMMWERAKGESYEDTFNRQDIKPSQIPNPKIVEVVHSNSLEDWAKKGSFESSNDLKNEIIKIMKEATVDPINHDRDLQRLFPPIYNFCVFATNTDRRGKLTAEAERIAELAWYGELAEKRLKEKTDRIFNVKPDPEKYKKASEKLQKVWGFSDIEIDAFRYFICQSRAENHNPSLNKSLYLFSGKKKTGKTTVARAIASVLNGETSLIDATKYESSFNQELQIGNHDLPMAAQYNCVILDEAMPKDSRKSYGRVKSMMTSNSCTYNQKYGKIITVKTKRYYIYTSNDDISDFVQDSSERRFIQINMERVPQKLSFEKIYDYWKEFAQNCEPEENWQEWYDSFEDVVGIEQKDISGFKDELLSNGAILQAIKNTTSYTITLKFFSDLMIVGKPTRDERKFLKKALEEVIGEPNGYRWNRLDVEERLSNKIEEQKNADLVNNVISEEDLETGLPF